MTIAKLARGLALNRISFVAGLILAPAKRRGVQRSRARQLRSPAEIAEPTGVGRPLGGPPPPPGRP
jgi:hypothetical protein